jgi:intermediate cleaving peptidase 55
MLTLTHTPHHTPRAAGILDGYHADITRTWPISGTFTPPQRALYQLVLDVQKAMIALCRPAAPSDAPGHHPMSLNELQRRTHAALRTGVQELLGRAVSLPEMDRLYPHHVSHFVGLSLHDTPGVSKDVPLAPGMVVTVEPGLYIPDEVEYGPFRGMGVRIEDVVAVGEAGPILLTVEAVKEVVDVESAMR